MRAIFLSQSNSLQLFYDLFLKMKSKGFIDNACFFISDPEYYQEFLKNYPDFENDGHLIIKEWELFEKAENNIPDIATLKSFEESFREGTLWPSIIANRRVLFGPKYSFSQDYASRFSHEEILSLLSVFYSEIKTLFDDFSPNLIFSFICTTTQEYICDQFARKNGVVHLNLRPTKVENYMHLAPTVHEPSERLLSDYQENLSVNDSDSFTQNAIEYLEKNKKDIVKYEGVFLPNQQPPQAQFKFPKLNKISFLIKKAFTKEILYRLKISKGASVQPGFIIPIFYRVIFNPLRVKKIRKYLEKRYIDPSSFKSMEYVFYPLHTEPEVTLLVYGRQYLNQLEVIRAIAYNLPINCKLLVKEHPVAVGKRPLSFYKKILDIPNVQLVDSKVETKQVIKHSKLITTISSSVGFEALIMKKPVIIFGNASYQIMPDNMVKKVQNINLLAEDINFLLNNFEYDHKKMINFIESIMRTSIPIDFYTTLLGRNKQHKYSDMADYDTELDKLTEYSIKSYYEIEKSCILQKNS